MYDIVFMFNYLPRITLSKPGGAITPVPDRAREEINWSGNMTSYGEIRRMIGTMTAVYNLFVCGIRSKCACGGLRWSMFLPTWLQV
jgi:hypothetical protein